jgi:uncharacterized membrane protein YgdD (TMEM256/DUF423 family)
MSRRWAVAAAGLSGAAGVALAAIAAHRGGGNLGTASQMLLFHAPALLVLGLDGAANRVRTIAAIVLAIGIVSFCGDLILRDLGFGRMFAFAAPAGGMAMIAGWLGIALSALAREKA